MSAAAISMPIPLLQDQDIIQELAPTSEPGPRRQLMDLDRRVQALELELADPRVRNESCKLMLKRTILRLCCCPYHTAAAVIAGIYLGAVKVCGVCMKDCIADTICCCCPCVKDCFNRIGVGCNRIEQGCNQICQFTCGVSLETCVTCEKQVSYPEEPETRVTRYFPDILCGIDTPIDPNNDPFFIPQLCCCCTDCWVCFVESRVELIQSGFRSRMRELLSVARLSQRATQVYEAFESGTRERRFTIHPETGVREFFDVPQSLMGIMTEYEYEVPAPTDEQMLEIPFPEDDQPMMQIPIPAGRQMTEEEIVRYRQREWREAEFRKRELERGIRKMKVDCAREGVQLPIGLKV